MKKATQEIIRKQIDKDLRAGLDSVISGKASKYEIEPFEPATIAIIPAVVKDLMTAKGFECGELETNGWQYDWWLHFTKAGKSFTASGSGYYGGFRFAKTEVA